MRAVRATAEAMRAWPTEIVERECVSVTPREQAGRQAGPGWETLFHREMPDEISPCPPAPPSPGGCWRGTQTGRDLSVWGPMSNVLGSIREDGTGHVVLSSISRQISTSPRSPVLPDSHGQNLPAGGHGSPAGRKRIPAGGGDPFSHRGRKDPRQRRGVISGPSTGQDGTRDWDGTEVADRLPAKPADSSEATGTVGQVDPPGQQKSGPAVTGPSHLI
jgi:hypothetical protein